MARALKCVHAPATDEACDRDLWPVEGWVGLVFGFFLEDCYE